MESHDVLLREATKVAGDVVIGIDVVVVNEELLELGHLAIRGDITVAALQVAGEMGTVAGR